MRIIVALLLALSSFAASALPVAPAKPMSECAVHLPYGVPTVKAKNTTKVCRDGYALEFDNDTKVPLWVAYTMTPEKAVGCFPRVSRFQADPAIKGSGFSKFYSGSGYDIGHMANDSDMRWSAKAEQESNLFPNAAPQLPGLNRGSWKSLEVRTRSYSVGGRTLQVIMGAVVSPDDKRLGTGPSIPHAFWKALIDQKTNEVVAFSYPQAETPGSPTTFRKLLSEALKGTGVTVPLPKGAKEVALWPLTTSSITAKAGVCAIN